MRFYLLAMLSLLAVTAHGQSIFKCKQHDGSTAYQDHPCPGAAPDARPSMTISPSDEASGRQSSQRLTPQQRAQLAASLERLQSALQAYQAKHPQTGAAASQAGSNIH